MGIIINQQDNRSELQKRIAAELTDKAKKKRLDDTTPPDGVDDSKYVEGTQQTGRIAWVWIALTIIVVASLIVYFVYAAGNTP